MSPRSNHPQSFISQHVETDIGLWAKNYTFPCHIEPDFVRTGKLLGFFKLFSTRVWKILFPNRKFDSHFTKSIGTWSNCIIATHKRTLSSNGLFQPCPLQLEQNSTLVFRHSCYTMLSNLVDFIFLRPLFESCSEAWISHSVPFPLTSVGAAGRPEVVHSHCSLKI